MSKGRLVVLAVVAVAVLAFLLSMQARSKRRQEGAKIVDRYVEVTGGAKAYTAIRSLSIHGNGTMNGKSVGVEEYREAPSRYCEVMYGEDIEHIQIGTDGKAAWAVQGRHPAVLNGDKKMECFREAAIDKDVRWRDFFKSAEYVGKTDFEGKQCYKVIMDPLMGKPKTRYYDMASNYLVGEESTPYTPSGPARTVIHTYDSYRKFGGILVPTKFTERMGDVEIALTVTAVDVNEPIPDEVFAIPTLVNVLLAGLPAYMK